MKVLYIGTVVTDKTIEKLNNKCKTKNPTMAGILFDRNIADGLSKHCSVEAISLIPIPSYPNCKNIWINERQEKYNNLKIKYLKFLNIPMLKYVSIIIKLMFSILKWNIENFKEKDKVIIIASIDTIFSLPSIIIKKIVKNKLIACVTDLPEFTISYRKDENKLKTIILKAKNKLGKKIQSKMDGYIFLSKYMNEKINKQDKPHIIIDGLVNEKDILKKNKVKKEKDFVFMYAGGLNVSYGIEKLVKAFIMSNIENSQLWIFGSGDYENKLLEIAKKNKNIKFMGEMQHNEVIEYEKKATILVNPRPTNEEYVKYSFPSKTLEYMLSGTPLLSTNLPTISNEYKEYMLIFKNESIEEMSKELCEVSHIKREKLEQLGERASKFILNNKTNTIQTKKIYEFILKTI